MWKTMAAAFKKYAVFRGRSDRSEFEAFFMFQVVISSVVTFAVLFTVLASKPLTAEGVPTPTTLLVFLGCMLLAAVTYGVASFLPTVALIVRRLHDTNRSGWWFWGWFLAYTLFWIAYIALLVGMLNARNVTGMFIIEGLSYFFTIPLSILMYVIVYWLAQPGTAGASRFGQAPVEFEPDSPVDGLQVQVSGFFRGVGRAWVQNWRRFGIQGRLSRSEYWCFMLPTVILFYVAMVCCLIGHFLVFSGNENDGSIPGILAFVLGGITTLSLLYLMIVAGIRRLHDAGYNGWWILIGFLIPFGITVSVYLSFKPSIAGGNRFGPQPMPML